MNQGRVHNKIEERHLADDQRGSQQPGRFAVQRPEREEAGPSVIKR